MLNRQGILVAEGMKNEGLQLLNIMNQYCIQFSRIPCGDLNTVLHYRLVEPAPWRGSFSIARPEVVLTTSVVTRPFHLKQPVVFRSSDPDIMAQSAPMEDSRRRNQCKPQLLCMSPVDDATSTCINIYTDLGQTGRQALSTTIVDVIVRPLLLGVHTLSRSLRFVSCEASEFLLRRVSVSGFGLVDHGNYSAVVAQGGAIAAANCFVWLDASVLRHNVAEEGGAFFLKSSSLQLTASEVSENRALAVGGGIAGICSSIIASYTDLKDNLVGPTLSENEYIVRHKQTGAAARQLGGGGIFCTGDGVVDIAHSSISQNVAGSSVMPLDGAGLRSDSCRVAVHSSRVVGNKASGAGGGFMLEETVALLESTVVSNNSAPNGGGVYCYDCRELNITDAEFLNNAALIFPNDSTIDPQTLKQAPSDLMGDDTMQSSLQGGDGGALLIVVANQQRGLLSLERVLVSGNVALYNGGGVALRRSLRSWSSKIPPSQLVPCSVGLDFGEGVLNSGCDTILEEAIEVGSDAPIQMHDTVLEGNSALFGGGGGMYIHGYELWQWLLDAARCFANRSSLALCSQNRARYGNRVATEGRYLHLIEGSTKAAGFTPYIPLQPFPAVWVLDAFFQHSNSLAPESEYLVAAVLEGRNCTFAPEWYHDSCMGSALISDTLQRAREGSLQYRNLVPKAAPGSQLTIVFRMTSDASSGESSHGGELVSRADVLSISECPAGTFYIEGLGCEPCPAGQYRQASDSSVKCFPCAAGSYPSADGALCLMCKPGTFSMAGSLACTSCSGLEFSGLGWSECLPCLDNARCDRGQLFLLNDTYLLTEGTPHTQHVHSMARDLVHAVHQFQSLPLTSLPCYPPPIVLQLGLSITTLLSNSSDIASGHTDMTASECWSAATLFFDETCDTCFLADVEVRALLHTRWGDKQVQDTALSTSLPALKWWLSQQNSGPFKGHALALLETLAADDLFNPATLSMMSSQSAILPCLARDVCFVSGDATEVRCVEGQQGPLCSICKEGWVSSTLSTPCIQCAEGKAVHIVTTIGYVLVIAGGVGMYLFVKSKGRRKVAATADALDASSRRGLFQSTRYLRKQKEKQPTLSCRLRLLDKVVGVIEISQISRDAILRILLSFIQTSTVLWATLFTNLEELTISRLSFVLPSFDAVSVRCVSDWGFTQRFVAPPAGPLYSIVFCGFRAHLRYPHSSPLPEVVSCEEANSFTAFSSLTCSRTSPSRCRQGSRCQGL